MTLRSRSYAIQYEVSNLKEYLIGDESATLNSTKWWSGSRNSSFHLNGFHGYGLRNDVSTDFNLLGIEELHVFDF